MYKWLIVLAGVSLLAATGCVEEKDKTAVQPGDEEVQVSDAVEHSGWMTDFEAAKAKAKSEGKHILLDFSGSDWCGWCIKLDDEVFSRAAFKEYADDNLILVLADFPNDKSGQSAVLQNQNKKLAEAFGIRGFPSVFILSSAGNSIAKTGYQAGGPHAYVEHLKKLIAEAK